MDELKSSASGTNEQAQEQPVAQHRPNGQFAPGNSLGNRWQKGQSGNPRGRKMEAEIVRQLEAGDGQMLSEAIGSAMEILRNPNHPHFARVFEKVLERESGKVRDELEHRFPQLEESIEIRGGSGAGGSDR